MNRRRRPVIAEGELSVHEVVGGDVLSFHEERGDAAANFPENLGTYLRRKTGRPVPPPSRPAEPVDLGRVRIEVHFL